MRIKNNKTLTKLILEKSKKICKTLKKKDKRKRGRPPLYEDYLIVAALMIKVLKGLSLRDLQEELRQLFPKAPHFTTLWYRLKNLNQNYLTHLIRQTAEEILKILKAKEFHCLIADGTGFGYSDTFKLSWMKGKKIRQVKSYVKTEVLVGVVKDKAVVVGVNTGRAYSDECKLLSSMLRSLNFRARYFLGDAYYGGVEILKKVRQLNMEAIVPIRDTVHTRVRNPHRLWRRRIMRRGGGFIRGTGLELSR